jgi:Chlamydia polymorphic membrane protein (Chlamydia_PMP) repeat
MVGGAIYLTGGKAFIDTVTFVGNSAMAGGAILVGPTAQLTISNADFIRNNATGSTNNSPSGGGAIYVDGGVLIAAKGRYKGNKAVGHGGAIMAHEASMRLVDIVLEDNMADGLGGAIALNRSLVQIASTTFERNDGRSGNGDELYIADDLDDNIDGTNAYCDPLLPVSFCYGFDDGTAIFEVPGGRNTNTNCQEVGLSDIFSRKCPNYKS